MFSTYIKELREITNGSQLRGKRTVLDVNPDMPRWPRSEGQIILTYETAIELGAPQVGSVSFLLLTNDDSLVEDGRITIIGPEIKGKSGLDMSFGKILLISGHGFDEDNLYERYQKMSLMRFDMELEGFSPRAIPQENKEWSRVSKKALAQGFSLEILGNELYKELHELDYVDSVESLFITSQRSDIEALDSIATRSNKAVQLLNKLTENLIYDCANCENKEICDEVEEFKTVHKKLAQQEYYNALAQ